MAEGVVSFPEVKHICTICLESFKVPKLLPCFHTFCAACLEKYIVRTKRGNRFECPLCKKSTDVPRKGANEFQTNFYIDEMKGDTKRETVPCDGCSEKSPANHFCLDCEEHFCSRCTDVHMNMKLSRHHKLKEMSGTEICTARNIKTRVFCTKHPNKEIEVICKQCDKLLCVLCLLRNHQMHKTREVAEEAKEVRRTVRAKLDEEPVSEVVRRKDKSVQILQETNTKFEVARKEDSEYVRKKCEEVQQSAEARAKKLEDELATEYGRVIRNNQGKIKELERACASLVSLACTAEHALELDNDVAILTKSSDLCNQLDAERKAYATKSGNSEIAEIEVRHALVTGDANFKIDVEPVLGYINEIEIVHSKLDVAHASASLACTTEHAVNLGNEVAIRTKNSDMCNQVDAERKAYTTDSIFQIDAEPFFAKIDLIPVKVKLKHISSFEVPDRRQDTIFSIAPISKGRAWVACDTTSCIYLVNIKGKVLQKAVIKQCYSVTTDGKDNCIATSRYDESIKRVSVSGAVEKIVSHTDGVLLGLAYRKRSDGEEELLFTCDSLSKGGAIFAMPYKKGANVSIWSSGHSLPYSIAVDEVEGNVCIGAWPNDCNILDKSGKELCQYKHSSGVYGVCSDKHGCFLVTNDSSKAACRITTDGRFFEELPAITGRRAAVDSNNRIWVGSKNGRVDVHEIV